MQEAKEEVLKTSTEEVSTEKVEEQIKPAAESVADEAETSIADVSIEETSEPEREEETEEEQPKEKSSLKEDDEGMTEKVKQRIKNVTDKFSTDARLWQATLKRAETNPELRLLLIKELENEGSMPEGSYEMAKSQLSKSAEKEEETGTESVLPDTPEIDFVKKLYKEEMSKQEKETQRRNSVLGEFEERHPDIAERENAPQVRQRIAVLEQAYKEEGMNEVDALEAAYNTLFNRKSLLEKEREKGLVEGQIQSDIKSIASTPSVSAEPASTVVRKLTREEEEARILLGMTREEYVKWKDVPVED